MSIDDRVGSLERETARHGEQLNRVSAEIGHVRGAVSDVGTDVRKLLEREAKRPGMPTVQTVALTCAGLGSIAGVVWWLIAQSPAVIDLVKRMDKLDDPQVGRVPALERRLETLTGWEPTRIVKGR
jgi:hypothetical protein